jgi:type IV pilus assembly protein PilM
MNLSGSFYRDKPLFGLDIGHASLKIMQINNASGKPARIEGYGVSRFAPGAIQNGEIINAEALATAAHQLMEKNLVGSISSKRVACSLPTSHSFSRLIKIPAMDHHDIPEAIRLEAEQYIPVPLDTLYLDYEIVQQDSQNIELLLVATSKKIVDSYLSLLQALDLEPVAFEPSISATSRLLKVVDSANTEPLILVDIGSVSTDITIYDKTLLVASTVNSGGDSLTSLMAKNLRLTTVKAEELKNQFGISYSDRQQRIVDAIKPQLETLVREIEKSIRYHSERAAKSGNKISRIITVGGGAVMPGLNQFLSRELRLPTQTLDPWQKISFGNLPQPNEAERSMYITVAGEAMLDPLEIAV